MMLDRVHILAIIEQVRLQGDLSPAAWAGFGVAYADAFTRVMSNELHSGTVLDGGHATELVNLIEYWGSCIKPLNLYGFRQCELEHPKGAAKAVDVYQRMHRFADLFCLMRFRDAESVYEEFELIHPFEDGNGRVGMLLWCVYTYWDTGEWPEGQPPDVFGVHK